MAKAKSHRNSKRSPLLGRCFVHPLFDYLLIGGGLSLLVIPIARAYAGDRAMMSYSMLPWFILCSNSAHFAASTVRLYTKPGTRSALPFLTMAFPIVSIAVLTLCMMFAGLAGPYLQALYLSWSPFHYAAQAYGIAVMYCYRSGCMLMPDNKRLLWWIAIIPFVRVLLQSTDKHVLWWFMPDATAIADAPWSPSFGLVAAALGGLGLVLPWVLYIRVWRTQGQPMPLISLLAVVTNGAWFILFSHYDAYIWATVFHGIQYLAIATVFHIKDQMARPENKRGPLYHAIAFYAVSLLLGYGLFNCWPQAYMLFGFGPAESVLLVIAVVNIHHFVVDAYIWKLKPGDSNRQVVATA
jgi:hypothetical protein